MTEKEFEQRLDLILLESMIRIQEIEEFRRNRVSMLLDEFLNRGEK